MDFNVRLVILIITWTTITNVFRSLLHNKMHRQQVKVSQANPLFLKTQYLVQLRLFNSHVPNCVFVIRVQ